MTDHDNLDTVTQSPTQNDKFKGTSSTWLWSGLILATAGHFTLIVAWPELQAEDVSLTVNEVEVIDVPDQIEIPPPPQAIRRPAVPIVSTQVTADVTIPETTFESNQPEDLPPPPMIEEEQDVERGSFSVFTTQPRVLNMSDVERALVNEYPPILRDSGIGGTVHVVFSIDEEGLVFETAIGQSSGHAALDNAALKIADVYRFAPALNRDKRVSVKVTFPITFVTR